MAMDGWNVVRVESAVRVWFESREWSRAAQGWGGRRRSANNPNQTALGQSLGSVATCTEGSIDHTARVGSVWDSG